MYVLCANCESGQSMDCAAQSMDLCLTCVCTDNPWFGQTSCDPHVRSVDCANIQNRITIHVYTHGGLSYYPTLSNSLSYGICQHHWIGQAIHGLSPQAQIHALSSVIHRLSTSTACAWHLQPLWLQIGLHFTGDCSMKEIVSPLVSYIRLIRLAWTFWLCASCICSKQKYGPKRHPFLALIFHVSIKPGLQYDTRACAVLCSCVKKCKDSIFASPPECHNMVLAPYCEWGLRLFQTCLYWNSKHAHYQVSSNS